MSVPGSSPAENGVRQSRGISWIRSIGVLGLYVVLAALCTRPLLELSHTHIAGDPGDPILNTSILWWNATVLPFTERWWNPPYFHLTEGVSAFTENLTGIGPISTPLFWATGNPLAAYNLTLFLTWPLSAFAAYLLVRFLTGRTDAALIGGLAYGFSPYRTAEMGHLQMVASFWFPLALLGLHGYLRHRRPVWLALFGAAWLLQSLANGYLMLYGAVLIGLWIGFFCSTRDAWRAVPAIGLAWFLTSLPLLPVMLKYQAVHGYYALRRDLSYFPGFSTPARAWLEVTDFIWFWRRVLPDGEDDLFPGVTALALVMAAMAVQVRWRPGGERSRFGRPMVLGMLAAVTVLSLISMGYTLIAGPWSTGFGGLVLRVSDIDRAVLLATVSSVSLLLLLPSTRQALARRSPFLFYVVALVAMAVLSCGPVIPVDDAIVFDYTPYYWLMHLPGFDGLRVPSRFWMLGVLCLATAAGLGFARLAPRRRWLKLPVLGLAAAGILVDGWLHAMPMAVAPELWRKVEPRHRTEPIAELPLGPRWDAAATYRSIWHRRGVFNGVSGYDPPHYLPLQAGLNDRAHEMLAAMASFGAFDAVVDASADPDGTWTQYVTSYPGAKSVATDGVRTAYRIPASNALTDEVGAALPLMKAQAFLRDASAIIDGRAHTEWGDIPQRPGQWVSVDLGVVRQVGGVSHGLGEYARDFPRRLAIDVSVDGVIWHQVWEGVTADRAFRAAVLAPRAAVMRFTFAPRPARFVRLRQLAEHFHFWRVAEVEVHAPAE